MLVSAPHYPEHARVTRTLMGPGPSDVDPRVLAAMARPLVGHLDPVFLKLMDEIQSMLQYVFQTTNEVTFPVSATGMAGMETCLVNLIEPGEKVLICSQGVFGERMREVAQRAGADVATITKPWGEVFTDGELVLALKEHRPSLVGVVHAETSTGSLQPLANWGDLCHQRGALLLVDCVTSLGGVPVKVDEWGIDAAYAGTQKCLSAPPGLSPITVSERALQKIKSRTQPVQSWYMDLTMVASYWQAGANKRAYHHTAPITMLYGLHEALRIICEETLPVRWQRHKDVHLYLKAQLAEIGITYAADPQHLLPPLNAVRIPGYLDDAAVRSQLLLEHHIEIGGGLGDFAGQVWRIGTMGHTCRVENVDRLVAALRACGASKQM